MVINPVSLLRRLETYLIGKKKIWAMVAAMIHTMTKRAWLTDFRLSATANLNLSMVFVSAKQRWWNLMKTLEITIFKVLETMGLMNLKGSLKALIQIGINFYLISRGNCASVKIFTRNISKKLKTTQKLPKTLIRINLTKMSRK
jgi:hypothetical protein